MLTEAELVRIYREHTRPLYAYVSRRVGGDGTLAEDIVQEAWLRAVASWPRKGPPEQPRAWLIRVARNLLVSHYRRRRPVAVDPAELDIADDRLSPETASAAALVSWGLSRLRRRQAVLLEAFYFERRSTREIAAESGLSERAVEGRLRRAVSRQLGESWRRELLEARLEVQLELAWQRARMQRAAVEESRTRVEQGPLDDRELKAQDMQVAQAEAEVTILELELEEVRRSGREPLGELSSPLIDGRDFVSARIRARMELAGRYLDLMRSDGERVQEQAAVGAVDETQVRQWKLAVREAQLQLDGLGRRLELRRAYLDSEISAVEAELKLLEVEAENRVALRRQQRELALHELERVRALSAAGTVDRRAVAQTQLHVAEVEGQLHLAEQELGILRRELERRAVQR